jgi:uncharacterized protein YjdB
MKRTIILALGILFLTSTIILSGCGISSNPRFIYVSEIMLNSENIVMIEGDNYQLDATITPSNATNKNLGFAVQDEEIATVDKRGKISAHKQGSTYVVVTSKDGTVISAVAQINVYQQRRDLLSPQNIIVNQIVDENKYILDWSSSDNALGYVVNINGQDVVTTSKTKYELAIAPGINTYKVKAIGDNEVIYDS